MCIRAFLGLFRNCFRQHAFHNPWNRRSSHRRWFLFGHEIHYSGAVTMLLTDLGIEDVSGETWDHSHEIGLWDLTASNTQIADATVDNTGTLISGFRYVHLGVQVLLTPTHQYTLAAYYFPTASSTDHLLDPGAVTAIPPTADPSFTGFTAMFTGSNTAGSLSEPTLNARRTGHVRPNFLVVPTPEAP